MKKKLSELRLNICKECDQYKTLFQMPDLQWNGRCKECGCWMWAKARVADTDCPLGKWDVIQYPVSTYQHLKGEIFINED